MTPQDQHREHEASAKEGCFDALLKSYDYAEPPAGLGHAIVHRSKLAFEAGMKFGLEKARRDAQTWETIYRTQKGGK